MVVGLLVSPADAAKGGGGTSNTTKSNCELATGTWVAHDDGTKTCTVTISYNGLVLQTDVDLSVSQKGTIGNKGTGDTKAFEADMTNCDIYLLFVGWRSAVGTNYNPVTNSTVRQIAIAACYLAYLSEL
jgi:hypothetical protein